ncbi:hypothetical protein NL676_009218 [Syzygium grande]|nr:hypothetical protein NL676_009218 [Syzygium grande]
MLIKVKLSDSKVQEASLRAPNHFSASNKAMAPADDPTPSDPSSSASPSSVETKPMKTNSTEVPGHFESGTATLVTERHTKEESRLLSLSSILSNTCSAPGRRRNRNRGNAVEKEP